MELPSRRHHSGLTVIWRFRQRPRRAHWVHAHAFAAVIMVLSVISVLGFIHYFQNGLGLAYNDARSHLDIGRRVVEGLKPGLAQLGSVWLPLPHLLMTLTIWNDGMWHSGLAGALFSMVGFVVTGATIYKFLEELGVRVFGRLIGVAVFVANTNVLYLQSTAMTELLLLATMTLGTYQLLLWHKHDRIGFLIKAGFWIMLATLVRYDGWFLLFFASLFVLFHVWRRKDYRSAEGATVLFGTLAGFGIVLWFIWNTLIFRDPLYFAFGPYSAEVQQSQLAQAGLLLTQHNWLLAAKIYWYALAYNSGAYTLFLGMIGAVSLWLNRHLAPAWRIATVILLAPFLFNVLALYFGHSVLFVEGLSGTTWFNIRYGMMMLPSIAIFVGYLVDRAKAIRPVLVGTLVLVMCFAFFSRDAVTIDDAKFGSSQKNVTEVSSWLAQHAKDEPGFVLISVASHDAILFSSGLPMKKFIHEGTGAYWTSAVKNPDRWARWIVMRTYSDNDQTYRLIKNTSGFSRFQLVQSFPFADIYQLKPEYVPAVVTTEVFPHQR